MTWLAGFSYAKEISLTGQSGAGTLYQVDIDIGASAGGDFHLEGHCTNFPQDIEITDDDGTTLLDFWIEDTTADPIKMWVEVADDLGSNQKIWVYYGKSGATTNSDIGETFILGDDFPGSSLGAKWNQDYTGCSSTATVSGGILTLDCGTACGVDLQRMVGSVNAFQSNNVALRFRHNVNAGGSARSQTWMTNTKPATAVDDAYHTMFTPSTTRAYDISTDSYINGSSQSKTCCDNVYSQNTWYTLEMQRIGNDYKTLVNDVVKNEDTRSGLSTANMYISLGIWADGPISWEWVALRKHIATPPAFSSAGSEQSAPAVGHPTMCRWGGIPGMRLTGRNSW